MLAAWPLEKISLHLRDQVAGNSSTRLLMVDVNLGHLPPLAGCAKVIAPKINSFWTETENWVVHVREDFPSDRDQQSAGAWSGGFGNAFR